jgi:hypothetical protein
MWPLPEYGSLNRSHFSIGFVACAKSRVGFERSRVFFPSGSDLPVNGKRRNKQGNKRAKVGKVGVYISASGSFLVIRYV